MSNWVNYLPDNLPSVIIIIAVLGSILNTFTKDYKIVKYIILLVFIVGGILQLIENRNNKSIKETEKQKNDSIQKTLFKKVDSLTKITTLKQDVIISKQDTIKSFIDSYLLADVLRRKRDDILNAKMHRPILELIQPRIIHAFGGYHFKIDLYNYGNNPAVILNDTEYTVSFFNGEFKKEKMTINEYPKTEILVPKDGLDWDISNKIYFTPEQYKSGGIEIYVIVNYQDMITNSKYQCVNAFHSLYKFPLNDTTYLTPYVDQNVYNELKSFIFSTSK
jgi:hypothetical protein